MARILIVDDDEGILDAIAAILTDEGYTVDTISKGIETYAKVLTFQPDLILLDILMSGSDGRTICRSLKADPKTMHIPIVMISAHPAAASLSSKAGADGFLPKPFGLSELLRTVEAMTGRMRRKLSRKH